MANEMMIDEAQFAQLRELLETVDAHTEQAGDLLERVLHAVYGLTDAVKAVEASVENLPHD